jgi:hypothetical protein
MLVYMYVEVQLLVWTMMLKQQVLMYMSSVVSLSIITCETCITQTLKIYCCPVNSIAENIYWQCLFYWWLSIIVYLCNNAVLSLLKKFKFLCILVMWLLCLWWIAILAFIFSYIMVRTSYIWMKRWWFLLCTRPTVEFLWRSLIETTVPD